jgi:hypothetical protein
VTPRAWVHLAVWVGLYAVWLVVTRGNQPTLPVAVVATFVLVATAAVAVYADWYVLRPRFAARGKWGAYVVGLIAVVVVLTFPTVQLIQWVYDAADVPKEGRFGFWTNVGYEAAWYAVHLAGGAAVRAVGRRNIKKDTP